MCVKAVETRTLDVGWSHTELILLLHLFALLMQILHYWFLLILAHLAAGLHAFHNFLFFSFYSVRKESPSFFCLTTVWSAVWWLICSAANKILLRYFLFSCRSDLDRPWAAFSFIKWIIRGAGCGGWGCWFWEFGQLLWCLARLKMSNQSRRKSAGPNAEETRGSSASRGNNTVNCFSYKNISFKVH